MFKYNDIRTRLCTLHMCAHTLMLVNDRHRYMVITGVTYLAKKYENSEIDGHTER